MCATMGCVGVLVAHIARIVGALGVLELEGTEAQLRNQGGLIIGLVTEYFTSHSYVPTRELASACKFGALFFVASFLGKGQA